MKFLETLIRFDAGAGARLRQAGAERFRWIFVLLAHSADMTVLFPAAGLVWLFGEGGWKSAAWVAGWALLAGTFATGLLKLTFRRRRPDGRWGTFDRLVDPHSFPSGHANRAAVLAVLAAGFLPAPAAAAVALWGFAVGGSRVVLAMHYPSDVLAGFLVGAATGVFFLL